MQTEIDCLNLWAFENSLQFHRDKGKRLKIQLALTSHFHCRLDKPC